MVLKIFEDNFEEISENVRKNFMKFRGCFENNFMELWEKSYLISMIFLNECGGMIKKCLGKNIVNNKFCQFFYNVKEIMGKFWLKFFKVLGKCTNKILKVFKARVWLHYE